MKNKKFTVLLAVAVLLIPLLGNAQSSEHHFSLKEVLQYGLENSSAIRQSVLDQEQAQHKVGEVRSSGLPQITGEGQFQNFPNLPTQLLPGEIIGEPGTQIPVQFGTEFNTSATFKLSQLLYSQEFFTGLKAAEASRELYKLMKIQSEEEVIYQVTNAFYQTLQLQSQIEILNNNLVMLNKLEKLIQSQYQNDLVTKTDFSRVKVNKANLLTKIQTLKTTHVQQNNYLKLLIGMPIESTLILDVPEELGRISLMALGFEKENPIQLRILEKQKSLTELERKSITAGYVPTLALFGQQSWQAQRNEFNFFDGSQPWFPQTVVGLQLQIPIFDGFNKRHRAQQSRINIEKLSEQRVFAERQLDMQYENARQQLNNSLSSVQAQEENRELAKEVLDQTQLLYKEEVAGLTDLLDAEQAYREAQTNYYNELLKFRISELDLLKALGQLEMITK